MVMLAPSGEKVTDPFAHKAFDNAQGEKIEQTVVSIGNVDSNNTDSNIKRVDNKFGVRITRGGTNR